MSLLPTINNLDILLVKSSPVIISGASLYLLSIYFDEKYAREIISIIDIASFEYSIAFVNYNRNSLIENLNIPGVLMDARVFWWPKRETVRNLAMHFLVSCLFNNFHRHFEVFPTFLRVRKTMPHGKSEFSRVVKQQ